VNTYEDESDVKVTLLEGAVDVSTGTSKRSLHPGQQARFSNDGIKVLSAVDIDEVMAWKNGQFYFAGTNIKTIMRQIEKYYNVEVEYKDDVPYQFVAKISRQVNVSEFLEKLELTNLVHFKIEGRKIIVTE
jgi:ferric-dicitrate binding protein FerR (iron transport regulator)